MYNSGYYSERKVKIEQRRQVNLQRFINQVFDFTNEAGYLNEQMKELEQQEQENKLASEIASKNSDIKLKK